MSDLELTMLCAEAMESFIASGKQCVKELDTVPPCKYCMRIPRNYCRFDDGSIACAADSSITQHGAQESGTCLRC